MIQLYVYIYMRKHNNNDERTHFFRKIYLSHFILERVAKGLILIMCERWVGDGTDCNVLTPSYSDYSSTSFSFCWAAQQRVTEGRKPSVWSWFSLPRPTTRTPTNWLQITQAVCGTWFYNCLTSTCFMWASQLHQIIPVHRSRRYPDIFDRIHLFLDWRLSRGLISYISFACLYFDT